MKKSNKKMAQFGNNIQNPNINPWQIVDLNNFQYPENNYIQEASYPEQTVTSDYITPIESNGYTQSNQSNSFQKIGQGMSAVGRASGKFFNSALQAGPSLLNALIPEEQKRNQLYEPMSYNPNPQGTGSQAIYRNGGYVTRKRKQGNIQITEEIPEQFAYDNLQQINSFEPIPVEEPSFEQIPIPQPKRVSYETLYNEQGVPTTYLPKFENFNYNESLNFLQDAPEYIQGLPVQRSPQQIREFNQNYFPRSNSFDWIPYFENGGEMSNQQTPLEPLYNASGELVTYSPIPQGKSGIHINPANKGKFTAQANRSGVGVQDFASTVLKNKEDYPTKTVQRANFAKNASKWNKKENGGQVGEEMDLSIEEINNLISKGYQIEFLNESKNNKPKGKKSNKRK